MSLLLVGAAVNILIISREYGNTALVGTTSLVIYFVLPGMILGQNPPISVYLATFSTTKPLIVYRLGKEIGARF